MENDKVPKNIDLPDKDFVAQIPNGHKHQTKSKFNGMCCIKPMDMYCIAFALYHKRDVFF